MKTLRDVETIELVKLREQGMSYREIANFLIEQGIQVRYEAIYQRLHKYYEGMGQEAPKSSKIKVDDEQIYLLKEKGLSDREISEHLKNQGIQISTSSVRYRLNKYCKETGKPKTKTTKVTDEQLYQLKESGMTGRGIAQYLKSQGIEISSASVNLRLNKYYEKIGKTRRKVTDEELYGLKEKGMTYKEIEEYLVDQGIKIYSYTIYGRLKRYCEETGKPRPKTTRKKVTDEQLYRLKEQGLSDKEISEYLRNQGIEISCEHLNKRLIEYYKKIGKTKPRKRRTNVTNEQLYWLKEEGLTDKEIVEYLKNQGIEISCNTVCTRLYNYYKKIGKSKPKPKLAKIEVTDEQLYRLREEGLTFKEIEEELKKQGIAISSSTINVRINEYCEKTGKPKIKTIREKVSIEKLYQLKKQGLTDKEIVEYLKNEGIDIAYSTISARLNKYYKQIGETSQRIRKRKVEEEQLYELKEQGLTDSEIVEYLKNQGIAISWSTVNRRINEYYKKLGKTKPIAKRIKVTDEQLYSLREDGLTFQEIEKELKKQGIEISWVTVNRRLNEYYKRIGKPKPNYKKTGKSKPESATTEVTDEELYQLREREMTFKEISEYLKSQGVEICSSEINIRVNEYCKKTGKPKVEITRAKVTIEKLYELKEKGLTDKEIAEFLKNEGIEITYSTIGARLNKYYGQIGKPKPKIYRKKQKEKLNNKSKKNSKLRRKVTDEQLYQLKEKGLTDMQIIEYLQNQGITISYSNVSLRLNRYYKQIGKPKPRGNRKQVLELMEEPKKAQEEQSKQKEKNTRKLLGISSMSVQDIRIVNMLVSGTSISESEFDDEQIQDINKRIEKLKFIARHSNKIGDRWIDDKKFIEVLDFLQNAQNTHPSNIYEVSIKKHLHGNVCQGGKIDLMKKNIFKDNEDLMTYVFLGTDITFDPEYDRKVWNVCKINYKDKINLYFARLYELEKRQKEKNETTGRNVVKQGEER